MATIAFDTLKLARKLEAAGFPQKQAADTTQALAESLGEVSDLATKTDLMLLRSAMAELRTELKAEMAEFRAELKGDMAELSAELKGDMAELRAEQKADMAEIRAELKADVAELSGQVKTESASLRAEFRSELTVHLRWMIGSMIGVAALAVAAVKLLP